MASRLAEGAATGAGIGSAATGCGVAGVAEEDPELRQVSHVSAVGEPERLDGEGLVEQGNEVVDLSELDARLAQPGLEILLRALLGMKADIVVIGVLPGA